MKEISDITGLAKDIRLHTVRMIHKAKAPHIGSSMSIADLLAVLYGRILNIDPADPKNPGRDRFITSKGHGCAAIYGVLAECGFFPLEWLDNFYQDGSPLAGHVMHKYVPGVEVSTGSLGHGLPLGCGMALAAKRDGKDHRVFTLLSDGECDEGSTWEAMMFAGHHQLDNLTAIVDYNKIQSLGRVEDVLDLEPFADKARSFGWSVTEIDGHDVDQIEEALSKVPFFKHVPSFVIAHTVKGKGVSFMEDDVGWHYFNPTDENVGQALREIEEGK